MGPRMMVLPRRLLPAGSAWCLQHPRCGLTKGRGWAKEAFSFGRLEACKAMKSWTSPVSARVHLLSRLHQHHQGVPLASSPGPTDSATPVPFSSFLRGFLGAGVGKAKEGEAGTSISYQWLVILPSQLPHQALVQVSFLGALVLVVLCYRVTIYCVRQPWHSE